MCMSFVHLRGLFILLIEENILYNNVVCLAQIVYVLYRVFEFTIIYVYKYEYYCA